MTSLKLSTVPHEYFFGDMPGTLQYKINRDELANMDLSIQDDDTRGYQLEFHTEDNYRRILPNTATARTPSAWDAVLFMKMTNSCGETWLKGALVNKATGDIALLTSTNAEVNLTGRGARAIQSQDAEWFVGHYRMCAPMIFWRELARRLSHK
jgi:hypothetical protein